MHRLMRGPLALVGILIAPGLAPGQPAGEPATAPRTAWGAPDLQGVWDFRTVTPLQRPADLAGRATLTAEEAAEVEQRAAAQRVDSAPQQGDPGTYNQFWFDFGTSVVPTRQTSLIVDPPDGRLPALTETGRARQVAHGAAGGRPVRLRVGGIGTDGPEDRGLAERCLLGFNAGPPMVPSGYNNNMQFFQTPDHVVILTEMVHDARLVPLDDRPGLPADVRQWRGVSRGYWEGDTLVVESDNFTDKTGSFDPSVVQAVGSGETLHLTERFTRIDSDTLLYEFTVNDGTTYSRPFTASIPMRRGEGPLFEYACHEGNYGLRNVLAGARIEERAAGTESGAR